MKKVISLILISCFAVFVFASCGNDNGGDETIGNTLSFSQANSVEAMQKLDGKQVNIIGYMSTLSPINGSFMYLMNLPYQSCPFCVPNTTQLSNTMAVYAKSGDSFEFTDRAIKVTGTLEFGDYTDEYGYEYGYRIKDATYTEVDTSEMSDKMKLWQQLASTNVISDVYNMYEYVNFLCFWPTYTAEFEGGKDYLYPTDAINFIETEGAQFNYGYAEGYFDSMINTIEEVSTTDFITLVENIKKAKSLAERAFADLKAEEFAATAEYSGSFGDGRSQYKMNNADTYEKEMETIYREFSEWLAEWEI
jgi:hypothetical protein